MPGVIPLQPFPVFQNPNQQTVHANVTVTASGSTVVTGYGVTDVTLFINVKAVPTGTSPTIQYTLQEVDPGDGATVIGSTVSSTVITGVGVQKVTLYLTSGGSIKVSWAVGGASPSFTQVYATMVGKGGSVTSWLGSTSPTVGQKAMSASIPMALASDQTPFVNREATGSLVALNQAVTVDTQGCGNVGVQITGTFVGTVVFEGTVDGTNWGAFTLYQIGSLPLPVQSASTPVIGRFVCAGMKQMRVRCSAFTSGAIVVTLDASAGSTVTRSAIIQSIAASVGNSSTANLASGAAFTGTAESTLGIVGIQVNCIATQPIQISVHQSPDGTNWDISDSSIYESNIGDGRTFQSTSSFFRVVATNLGGVSTTSFRLQVALCPIADVLPRALTPHGKLGLATETMSWAPDPSNHLQVTSNRALNIDRGRNLNVRARVLTDETSFRTDFTAGDLFVDLTGTCYFTNGSVNVTGVGTDFQSQVFIGSYVKISTHADTAYAFVAEVNAPNRITLDSTYTGATASGTGRNSDWVYSVGAGGSVTQSASLVNLVSGTTSGTDVSIQRLGDYLPFIVGFSLSISQRIANQTIYAGMSDAVFGSSKSSAMMQFSGTDATKVTLSTSFSSADVQSTVATLPSLLTTATEVFYQLEVMTSAVALYANGILLAKHELHIPGPYATMNCFAGIKNTGAAGSTTTASFNTFFLTNFDRVETANSSKSTAGAVTLYTVGGAPVDAANPLPVIQSAPSGALIGLAVGRVALGGGSAATLNVIHATTYAEQSSNAQRSVKSSSASDASAGVGARQVTITYYTSTGAGPFTEVVTMNGTTAVNTSSTTICFVESIVVTSVGSTGTNVGTITLFTTTGGGGSAIGTVGTGNIVAAVGDGRTYWAHHYVAIGKVASFATVVCGLAAGTGSSNGSFFLKSVPVGVANAAEVHISDLLAVATGVGLVRQLGIPLRVTGPARVTGYAVPSGNNTTCDMSFDFSEL